MFSKISHVEISRITEKFLRPERRMFVYGVEKNTLENKRKAARDFVNAFNSLISSQKETLIDSMENEFLYEPYDSKAKLSPKLFKSLTGDKEFRHSITGNIVLGFKLSNFTMNSGVCADETFFIPEVEFCLDKVYFATETGDYIELENISKSLKELSGHSALDMEAAYRALKGNGIHVKVCSNLDVSKFFNGEGKEVFDAFREYLIMTSYKALKYYAEKETQYDTIGPAGRFVKALASLNLNKKLEIHVTNPKIVKNNGKHVFIRIPTNHTELGTITISMSIVEFLRCFVKLDSKGEKRDKVICLRKIKGYELELIFNATGDSIGQLDFTRLQTHFDNRIKFKRFQYLKEPLLKKVLQKDDPVIEPGVSRFLGVVTIKKGFLSMFRGSVSFERDILKEIIPEIGLDLHIGGKFITTLNKDSFEIVERSENIDDFIFYDLYIVIKKSLLTSLSHEKQEMVKNGTLEVITVPDDNKDYVEMDTDLILGENIICIKDVNFN